MNVRELDKTKLAMSIKDYIADQFDYCMASNYEDATNSILWKITNRFDALQVALNAFVDLKLAEDFYKEQAEDLGLDKEYSKEDLHYINVFVRNKIDNYCNIDDIAGQVYDQIKMAVEMSS